MKAKNDWKAMGQFVGLLVKLSTIISGVFKEAKLGFEVLEWLVGDGKSFLIKKLKEVVEEYKNLYPEIPVLKIKIDRNQPFNPEKFIGQGWTFWKGPANGDGLSGEVEQDARSLAISEIDCSRFIIQTGLEKGETVITGEVKRARLILQAIQADAKIAQTLYE